MNAQSITIVAWLMLSSSVDADDIPHCSKFNSEQNKAAAAVLKFGNMDWFFYEQLI
jgi:hypothetical protein